MKLLRPALHVDFARLPPANRGLDQSRAYVLLLTPESTHNVVAVFSGGLSRCTDEQGCVPRWCGCSQLLQFLLLEHPLVLLYS